MIKNKTVLITGASGFIGSHLADVIHKADAKRVILFDNLSASNIDNIVHLLNYDNVEFVRGDIRDYHVIRKYVLESDYVFNLAATNIGNSDIMPRVGVETNIMGTFNIFNACLEKPEIRVVHASSGSVLGSSINPADENATLKPTSLYGVAKMSGEKLAEYYAKEKGVKSSIVRYFHIFGPRQDMAGKCGVINIFLSRILKGLSPVVWGDGEQIKCFTYVSDAVQATMLTALDPAAIGETYNVASKTRITINTLAELLLSKYSPAEILDMVPEYAPAKQGENMNPNPDTTKIEELGFREGVSFEEGLDLTYKWVRKHYENKIS